MRYSEIIAASLVVPLVAAHGIEGAPSVFGLPKHLRASNPLAGFQARQAAHPVRAIGPRQAAGPERCGPEFGNQVCGGNDCCSPAVSICLKNDLLDHVLTVFDRDTAVLPRNIARHPTASSTTDLGVMLCVTFT
jgi:hypothetical protein